MKKFFKIIGILFALFLLAIVGLVIALKVMYPPEKVAAIVNEQASKYGKRDIKVGGASLTIYPVLGIRITDIQVSNTVRHNTLEKPTKLWLHLKASNLDKRFVNVTINGKVHEHTYKNDADLKTGDKLVISRVGFRDKAPIFALKELFVAVKVMPLIQRKVEIKKIKLTQLKVLVEVDSRGSFNFDDLLGPADKKAAKKKAPEAKKSEEASQPISLRLDSFEIDDAQIVYSNHKSQQEIVLDAVNQTLSAQFDSTMTDVKSEGLFEIKKMAVRGKNMPVRKSGMYFMLKHKLYVNLKKSNLRIDELTVGLQKTFLTLTGTVNGYDKQVRHLDLTVKTTKLRLQDLFKEVPPAMFPQARKMSVSGNAKLTVTVKGKLDAKKPGVLPAINGRFQIWKGRFKYADLPKAINALNMDAGFTQNSLDLKQLAFKLGTNPVSIVAKVINFKKPTVDVAIKADVDLGSLKDAVKLPKGVTAKGQLKANITAKGKVEPKNPEAIAVKGQLDLKDIVVTTPAVKKPVGLNGTFKFSNQEISLEKLAAKIGRSALTVDMKIKDYLVLALPKKVRKGTTSITFDINAPLLDLNEMLGTSSSKSSGKSSAKSSGKSSSGGGSDDTPIVIPKLPNVVVDGKIRFGTLQYKTLPIKKGAIDIGFKQKKLTFSLSAGLFQGKFAESLNLNLSNPNRISLSNKMSVKKVEANDFISRFNDLPTATDGLMGKLKSMDNMVYGKMDMTSSVKTAGITVRELKKNLDGTVIFKLYRGKIKNASIITNLTSALPKLLKKFVPKIGNISTRKTMQMHIAIRKGKLHISKLNIPLRAINLGAHGTIGLDSIMDMKVDMVLSRSLSRKILRQQKRLQKAAGGLINKIGGGGIAGKIRGKLGKAVGGLQLIPSDKKGRVVPIIGAIGSAAKPIYKFFGFKGAKGSADTGGGGKVDLKGMAKKQLKNLKKKAMAAANAAKKKALKMANDAKKKALKAANDAKKKALKMAGAQKKKALKAAADAKRKAQRQAANAAKKARAEAMKRKKEAADKAKKALGKW